MTLLQKSQPPNVGYHPIMTPERFALKYLSMGRLILAEQTLSYHENSGDDELVLDVLSGICDLTVDGEAEWKNLGGRESFFQQKPTMAYIPRRRSWSISAIAEPVHAIVFRATARRDTAAAVVGPDDVELVTIGTDTWQRKAVMSISTNVDADRLIVGETYNLPGKWSSYPPHKHDTANPPAEDWYEEIYHFAVQPREGFGIQRVYTGADDPHPLDEVYVVEDGDTVAIPRGYHPVAAAPGYQVGYIWALAGENRSFGAWSVDPRYAWINEQRT